MDLSGSCSTRQSTPDCHPPAAQTCTSDGKFTCSRPDSAFLWSLLAGLRLRVPQIDQNAILKRPAAILVEARLCNVTFTPNGWSNGLSRNIERMWYLNHDKVLVDFKPSFTCSTAQKAA